MGKTVTSWAVKACAVIVVALFGLMLSTAFALAKDYDSMLDAGIAKANGEYTVIKYPKNSFSSADGMNEITLDEYKGKPITKVSTSNSKVVAVKSDASYVRMVFKKAGKAVVKYKWNGKAHRLVINVKKYVNPLKTFKIGSKSVASKFNKDGLVEPYTAFKSDKLPNGKLKVEPKSGWKIASIKVEHYTPDTFTSKSVKSGYKIKKNKVDIIRVTCVNKKTKAKESLFLGSFIDGE